MVCVLLCSGDGGVGVMKWCVFCNAVVLCSGMSGVMQWCGWCYAVVCGLANADAESVVPRVVLLATTAAADITSPH